MNDTAHSPCINACNLCAAACSHCARACLEEPDVAGLARCIGLDLDCAAVCQLTAAAMARGSELGPVLCEFCASICERCAAECARHEHDHCQSCASMCRRCAVSCREAADAGSDTLA